jgi:hypothetical protein
LSLSTPPYESARDVVTAEEAFLAILAHHVVLARSFEKCCGKNALESTPDHFATDFALEQ